jgi:hypothetical protein
MSFHLLHRRLNKEADIIHHLQHQVSILQAQLQAARTLVGWFLDPDFPGLERVLVWD